MFPRATRRSLRTRRSGVLKKNNFAVAFLEIVPDDEAAIKKTILLLTNQARLVVTTGGTGIAPRDVTPEATRAICDRLLEGVAEQMRAEGAKKTPFAALSRGVCGIRGTSLILNLPGSPARSSRFTRSSNRPTPPCSAITERRHRTFILNISG